MEKRKKIEILATDDGVVIAQGENQIFVGWDALPRVIVLLLEAMIGLNLLEKRAS